MPASRSARAMIFAPRSCPSSPGLATTTRIFWLEGADSVMGARGAGIIFPSRPAGPAGARPRVSADALPREREHPRPIRVDLQVQPLADRLALDDDARDVGTLAI